MASPNFTHVYAALIAMLNTKLPDIAKLIIHRVMIQFQRAFKRNNKIVCLATSKMLAHLVNQQVICLLLPLQILALLLDQPTEDSVEVATDFMIECGQVLQDLIPSGVNAIFERFRQILHEGEIDKRVQYTIENLFAIRKARFADHPGVLPELDIVREDDRITHEISLEDEFTPEEECNLFQMDPNYEQTEENWDEIKKAIIGEEAARLAESQGKVKAENDSSDESEPELDRKNEIEDMSGQDLTNLRRTIYLTIMSSLEFEDCVHKILKLNVREGQEI